MSATQRDDRALERRYRRLLRAYPAGYRHERGDEIVGTLLDAAAPGQRRPDPRQAARLVMAGLRTRAGTHLLTAERLWLGALRLAAIVSLTHLITVRIGFLRSWVPPGESALQWAFAPELFQLLLAAGALIATATNRFRTGLALASAALVVNTFLGAFTYDPFALLDMENSAYLPALAALAVLARQALVRPDGVPWWLLALCVAPVAAASVLLRVAGLRMGVGPWLLLAGPLLLVLLVALLRRPSRAVRTGYRAAAGALALGLAVVGVTVLASAATDRAFVVLQAAPLLAIAFAFVDPRIPLGIGLGIAGARLPALVELVAQFDPEATPSSGLLMTALAAPAAAVLLAVAGWWAGRRRIRQ
ncbi:hypothetical protein Val02_21880 [Virgisporangium aliadipatigenens]|uniref:Uncharacterized protein n=1 Tax=Virgisporangium aliadipatigenens TaxID=741659 RepID=A0A8J3YJ06_9ACTN|nr:hypothetical protein [Virgisporangium aliadipatigenens]GIJ45302.1 hypothetical protein Val02_21880 [Virgisporangium aliadipatigenens]